MNLASTPGAHDAEEGRGRSMRPGGPNPFDDDAEPSNISMRGVSPRPIDTHAGATQDHGQDLGSGDSPAERRSVFREEV